MFNLIAKIFVAIAIVTLIGILGYNWYSENQEKNTERKHRINLQADSTETHGVLTQTQLALLVERNGRKQDKANFEVSAARFESGILAANKKADQVVNRLNAYQLKEAADADIAGIGKVPTTVKDSTINKEFGRLKGRLKVYEDSIPVLHKRIGTLEGQVSDLENELNGTKTQRDNAVASSLYAEGKFIEEAQTNRTLGWGRKKAMRKAAEEVRVNRQGKK